MSEKEKKQKSRGTPAVRTGAAKPAKKASGTEQEPTQHRQEAAGYNHVEEPVRSEELYRAIVENQVEFVDRYLPGGILTFVNDALARYMAMQPEDLIGRSFFPFLLEDDRQDLIKKLDSLTQEQSFVRVENRVVLPDGSIHWHQWTHQAFFDKNGKVLEYQSVGTDITERKHMEDALRESEQRLRLAQSYGSVGVWNWDVQTGRLNLEPELESLYGLPQGSIRTYGDWAGHVHPEDLARVESERDAALSCREPFHVEFRIMHSSGEVRWIAAKGKATYDEAGRLLRVLGINIDITAQKLVEEALRDSETGYRTLAENLPDIVYRVHLQGSRQMQFFNERINDLTGFSPDDFATGRICAMESRMVEEDRGRVIETVKKAVSSRSPFEVEYRFLAKNGTVVTFLERGTVITGTDGEPLYIDGVIRDITDCKETEAKLRQSEEMFRAIIETEPECVKIIDKDERLVMMNPAGLAMIEADSLDRIRGQKVYGIVSPEYRDAFSKMVRDVFAGNTGKLVFEMTGLKGTHRWLDTVSVPLRDASGGIMALLGVTRDVTERKKIEQALRESERKYRELVENANSIILKWDVQGQVTFINEFAQRFFGFTDEEILGKNVVGTIVPATESSGRDLEQLMRDICADPERFRNNENENITKDGRRVWVHWANRAILNDEGELTGVLSIGTDETGRREMFAAIQESEKRIRLAMAVSRQGFFEIDIRTGDVMVSPEYSRMMGYEPDEYPARHMKWHDLIYPDDRTAAVSAFEEYLTGRRDDFRIEFRQKTKSGQSRWILAVGTITGWDHDGNPARILGTFTDITQRRLAEEQALQSEQFRRSMLETVDEGFIVMDMDYRILTANNAFCRQVGMSCEEIIGKYCYAVSHKAPSPCYEEGEECAVRRVFETGEPCSAVHRHPDAGGNVMYVETKAFPLKDAGGKVTSVIETINNISERYLLEEERLKTQKLEAIGTLAGGIAHDFNNLLQGVFGFVSMAKMTLDQKEKALEMLEQAERALHMSVNLTMQLLTFSKGGKPVKKRIVLGPVIENSVKFSLSGSRSDYRLDIAPDLLPVEADEGQISQVLQNIVLNADQAMPMGGTVEVAARNVRTLHDALPAVLAKGNHVAISVSDSGIGIAEKYLSRIFDPYFTTKEKGSGLGLATSFSIIRNHDGIIDAKSEVGRGSEFTIYLPAVTKDVEVAPARPLSADARKGRILLMDDEEMIRIVAGELLRALGHDVALSKDGQEAIEMYRDAKGAGIPFDIVILDLTIRGGMGGAEAVKGILEIDPDAKAVVSSGYADSEVVSRYRSYGFCGTLSKPYTIASLKTMLDELLK